MNSHKERQLLFLQVRSPAEKWKRIIQICQKAIQERRPLLIKTANRRATELFDELLWSEPKHSFLPHAVGQSALSEALLIISEEEGLFPGVHHCLNSAPQAVVSGSFLKIYDFEDLQNKERAHLSTLRLQAYKEANFAIASF